MSVWDTYKPTENDIYMSWISRYRSFLARICKKQSRPVPYYYEEEAVRIYSKSATQQFLKDSFHATKPYFVDKRGIRYYNVFVNRSLGIVSLITGHGRVILGNIDKDNNFEQKEIEYSQYTEEHIIIIKEKLNKLLYNV